jgi:hypothetical protein
MMIGHADLGPMKCIDCGYEDGDWLVVRRPVRPFIVVKVIFVIGFSAAFGYFAAEFVVELLGVS